MAVLTPSQSKELIAIELGGIDDPKFMRVLNLRWSQFMDQDLVDPRLREMFVRRSMIDYLLGNNWYQVNWRASTGTRQDDSDRNKHLQNMRDDINENIKQIQSAQSSQIGELIAKTPITPFDIVPETDPPDPSNREYRGDPLRRSGG